MNFPNLGGVSITQQQKYRINDKIKVPEVLVIDDEGKNLGVLSVSDAIHLAQESELDLVEVSPEANPPVCRILDYGKLKYQQKKKVQQKKKPKTHQKEVRLRPRISENDIQVKLRQVKDFMEHGDKVLITINFRGREMVHLDGANELMHRIIKECEDSGKVEKPPKLEGRRISMVMVSKL